MSKNALVWPQSSNCNCFMNSYIQISVCACTEDSRWEREIKKNFVSVSGTKSPSLMCIWLMAFNAAGNVYLFSLHDEDEKGNANEILRKTVGRNQN